MRKCMPIIKFAAVCALCVLMVGFRFYIADAEQNQQTSAVQITDSGGSRVSEDGRVKVSKTIAAPLRDCQTDMIQRPNPVKLLADIRQADERRRYQF